MEPLTTGEDYQQNAETFQEKLELYGVPVILHRFQSNTGGTYNGTSPTRVDKDYPVKMRVYQISQQDVVLSGGIMAVGDLKTHSLVDIVGFNTDAANLATGDKLTYGGRKYLVKGTPKPVMTAGGRVFTEALWRRV